MNRRRKLARSRSTRLGTEALEDRRVPATFAVVDAGDAGPGTLRRAITDANASPGADVITFDLPGEGVRTIRPLTALPAITDALAIDGYSQPGSRPNSLADGDDARLLIELDGSGGSVDTGLDIRADDSSVRGLAINRFSGAGIGVGDPMAGRFEVGPTRVAIAGNRIGVDATGALGLGNLTGIFIIRASDVSIGGTSPGDGNVISANFAVGIAVGRDEPLLGDLDAYPERIAIAGNRIGVDATGTASLGNGGGGIRLRGVSDSTVLGNVLSANGGAGLSIEPSVIFVSTFGPGSFLVPGARVLVAGNAIGTDRAGARALGNGGAGILLVGTKSVTIGASPRFEEGGNIISANLGDGIRLTEIPAAANPEAITTAGTVIQGNLIGTGPAGADLGNRLAGINLQLAAGTTYGGGTAGRSNAIRFNRGPAVADPPTTTNYDGSSRSNLAVYLPGAGAFDYRPVAPNTPEVIAPFGLPGAGQTIPATGDYDGDGRVDLAAYLPTLGVFAARIPGNLGDTLVGFGLPGVGQTLLATGDYDGDGPDDLAVYLPALGAFGIRPSGGGGDALFAFGLPGPGQTLPTPGDYDGDGRDDAAAYLPALGAFGIRFSAGGGDLIVPFGLAGVGQSIPATGDYDGDGKADLAVYLAPFGAFAYRPSGGGPDRIVPFGVPGGGAIPVPGDYSGSGRAEIAVFNPTFGAFAYRPGRGGPDVIVTFGAAGPGVALPLAATPGAQALLIPAAPATSRAAATSVDPATATPRGAAQRAKAAKVAAKGAVVPGGPARRPVRPAVARDRPDRAGILG